MRRKPRRDRSTSAKKGKLAVPSGTVAQRIEYAFRDAIERLGILTDRLKQPGMTESEVLAAMPELEAEARRAKNLAFLAHPSTKAFSSVSAVKLAKIWRQANSPESEINKCLRMAGRKRRGRPATLRGSGLLALNLRLQDKRRWTWKALAEDLCNCGASHHGFNCREKLRREVLLMEKALKRLGVFLPEK